jgi:hypothetical protein
MNFVRRNGLLVPTTTPQGKLGVEGWVQCSVIDGRTQKVLRQYKTQHNLILNNGLNNWCNTVPFANNYDYAVVGTGTTVTSADSTPSTAAQAGTTVTVTQGAGSFAFTSTAVDAGRMIKWGTSEEARVVTVTDPTHAEVTPIQSVTGTTFSYFYTNQAGLTTEIKRTTTYSVASSGCGSNILSLSGPTIINWRTYDFSIEAGPITYNEIGFSNTNSAGANLWARIKLASPIALVSGQQLRVKYTINLTISPTVLTAVGTSPITGWPTASGDYMYLKPDVTYVRADNGGTAWWNQMTLEPSYASAHQVARWTGIGTPTWQVTPSGSFINRAAVGATLNTYQALDFFRTKTISYAVGSNNATDHNVIVCGFQGATVAANIGWIYIMDTDQTKDSTHTLSVTVKTSVSRVLA